MATLVATIGEGLRLVKDCVVVQGGTITIAEATPAAKASPRACREASASTNAPRGGSRDGHAHRRLQIGPASCVRSIGEARRSDGA
jgi:hypothetical protein